MATSTKTPTGQAADHAVQGEDKPLRAEYMKVTPEQAQRWLDERNVQNRPVREKRVDRYAGQMKKGEWMASPDAIAFDYNDNLINGQHRLQGVVQAQEPQVMLVAWNLHPDAFMISDVGIKRTAADALAIEGFEMPQETAAVVRLIALHLRGELDRCNEYELVQNTEIVNVAEKCTPRLQESIRFVGEHKQQLIELIPRSLMSFVHFVYTPTYGQRPSQFIEAFCDAAYVGNWEAKFRDDPDVDEDGVEDPASMLKDKMEKSARTSGELERVEKLNYLIQAMNWYCKEEPHKRLRKTTQGLPEIEADRLPEFTDQAELPV